MENTCITGIVSIKYEDEYSAYNKDGMFTSTPLTEKSYLIFGEVYYEEDAFYNRTHIYDTLL